jgi:hypothetical protein
MPRLNCYATGDGALSFCWLEGNLATGQWTTLADAQAYLNNDPDGRHYKERGWTLHVINGLVRLVGPVRRVNENTLHDGDEPAGEVTYEVTDAEDLAHFRQHRDYNTAFYFTVPDRPDLGKLRVKNWSIIARCCFFLNHEKALTTEAQPA